MGATARKFIFIFILQFLTSSCAVRLYEDLSNASLGVSSVSTSTQTIFNGWTHVQALGGRTPITSANQLATTTATVTLEWEAVTFSGVDPGTIDSYNIYRATTSDGQDLNTPLATGASASTLSYTDTTVAANTTYYYFIAPVVGGTVYFPESTTDKEIKVIVPPTNMSLVHRWIANREICTLLGETPDRDNDYRCNYNGPGKSTGDFYDLEKSYFIDTVEAGCNYTRGVSCGGTVCLGTGVPGAGIGNDGDIYYRRGGTGVCYIKRAGAWVTGANATDPELGVMNSNSPGLPPFVVIDQTESNTACTQYSVNGITKTLMSRKLQFVASAYDKSLSDADIDTLEDASGAYAANGCNTDSGHGAYPSDNNAIPTNFESLPYSTAGGQQAYRTGSTSTAACVSRFGIQDLTGNVYEWVSDQINAGVGITSAVVPTNSDLNGLDFDDNESVSTSDNFLNFLAINLALGIPMAAAAPSGWSTPVGAGVGDFGTAKFHGDDFLLNTSGSQGALVGGVWSNGSLAGRFFLILSFAPSLRLPFIGFRCAAPAE